MINKKFMFLAIFFVSLLAVSAVSAANNATSDIVNDEETTDEFVSIGDNQVILKENKNVGTFTELANEITNAGSQLSLTKNYICTDNDSSYKNGIILDKSIVINGNGFTLNGNNNARIFNITATEVVLNNINFVNGTSFHTPGPYWGNDNGGAIYWSGDNGVLANCTFISNSAVDSGGAIYGGSSIVNCTFISNSARGYYCYAGAIYCGSSVVNCTFIGNSADIGGAIYNTSSVVNCSFVNCSAGENSGGAISRGFSVVNCSFVNCSAVDSGGAISRGSSVVNCSFVNCSSRYGGGAIYDTSSVVNCTFIDNCAINYGGGAIFGGSSVVNCIFINNSARDGGGAIYDTSSVVNCSFIDCYALGYFSDYLGKYEYSSGGAIYWSGNTGILYDCSFVDCSADYGGAVYWEGYDSTLMDCSFVNCSAGDIGGAVWGSGSDNVLKNCSFIDCSVPKHIGGAVYLSGPYSTISDCSFVDCSAPWGGGAIYWECNNGVLYGCSFQNPSFGYDDYILAGWNIRVISEKTNTNLAVNKTNYYDYGSGELIVTLTDSVTGKGINNANVIVNLNNKNYTLKTDSNGRVKVSTASLTPKTYTATISYGGDVVYRPSSTTAKVIVNKADTIIFAPDIAVAYKDPNDELVATIVNEHGKPLIVTLNVGLNGKTYTVRTNSSGQASIPIDTLAPGTYTATISYKGSSNYKASSTTAKVKVTKAATIISTSDVNAAYKDPNGELAAAIVNEHGKPLVVTLNINFNGKDYAVKTDSSGRASIPIGTLTPGKYTATISYKGSSNYKASAATAKVTVTKAATVISAPDVNIAYKDSSGELVATIVNEHGKALVVNLNVNLNGEDYTVKTDSKGQARIAVDTLTPGTYAATISYKGSGNYKASSTTAQVKVTKAATIISAPDVSVAYGDPNGKLVSTITNEYGKPLVVNLNVDLNGKTYTVRTDSKGQISVSTADLAPGTYTATVSYKGSGNYNPASTTAKITVNNDKIDTSISVVYNFESKEIVATLTDIGGEVIGDANLVLNILDMDYSLTTDSKGQVKFSTAYLEPGLYAITVSYGGQGIYNPTSKSVKVLIQ